MSPEFVLHLIQALTPITLGVLALIAYRIRIRFLAKVFCRAGKRKDLVAAGKAAAGIGHGTLAKILRILVGSASNQ